MLETIRKRLIPHYIFTLRGQYGMETFGRGTFVGGGLPLFANP